MALAIGVLVAGADLGMDRLLAVQAELSSFDALETELMLRRREFSIAYQVASTAKEKSDVVRDKEPGQLLVGPFLKFAVERPNDPDALSALRFVFDCAARVGDPKNAAAQAREQAIALVLKNHLKHSDIVLLFDSLHQGAPSRRAEELLRRVATVHPQREARAAALYHLALVLESQSRMKEFLQQLGADPKREQRAEVFQSLYQAEGERFAQLRVTDLKAEAVNALRQVQDDYADVPRASWNVVGAGQVRYRRASGDTKTFGLIAEKMLFEIQHLQVGAKAPEIEARDYEGKLLKLSDYRGKVVVLVFSGSWCAPCKAMYPDLRELVKEHGPKSLAVLAVMSDATVNSVANAITKGDITWRCWWDTGQDGPIASKWNVQAWPQVYVLDRQGEIHYRNLRGEQLRKAVQALLDKSERPPGNAR